MTERKPIFQEADEFVDLHPEARELVERFKDLINSYARLVEALDQRAKAAAGEGA